MSNQSCHNNRRWWWWWEQICYLRRSCDAPAFGAAAAMEGGGGGTRLGSRSSTRHGPAAVFSGPVRRWKKTWTPTASSNPSPVASRVLLYKWTSIPPSSSGGRDENPEESNTRPIRYLPVSVVLEQRKEAARKAAEEAEATAQEEMNDNVDLTVQALPLDARNSSAIKGSEAGGFPTADGMHVEQRGNDDSPSENVPSEDKNAALGPKTSDVEMEQYQSPEADEASVDIVEENKMDVEMASQLNAGSVSEEGQ
eukprot:c23321_g1_i1 orf=75-833(+)